MAKKKYQKGTVIIITFVVLTTLLFLGAYFLVFSLTESKISRSQGASAQAYYLAEAGINEAIWKLKNDSAWADNFIDCDNKNPDPSGAYWSDNFSRSFANGSYTVFIQNSACGRGEIISTSVLPLANGKMSRRVVKTAVFKSLASLTKNSALLSGGSSENVNISFSKLRINKGNLFSNHNLKIQGTSTVEVYDDPNTLDDLETPETENLEGQVLAVGNYSKSFLSSVNAEAICAKNACSEKCEGICPPISIGVPAVDFDSLNSTSFKNRAQTAQDTGKCSVLCNGVLCDTNCVYSSSGFEDILWQVGQGGTLTLNNEITYVTGDIDLKGGRYLIINGTLVTDDNIYFGENYSWTNHGQKDQGYSRITVNRPSSTSPSGVLTKRKINFGLYSQSIDIEGVIYANDEVRIMSVPESFTINGGIIARKLSLSSVWQWLDITLNNDIIIYGLGYKIDSQLIDPTFSPVITIDHWEESY